MPTTINTPRDTTIQATNTALGLLGKDASLQDIKTALLQIVAALTPSIDNDYEELINKPSINSVSLVGNKTSKQLGIRQIIPMKSEEYAQLTSAEKLDDDIDYLITDRNAVSVPIDDDNVSVNKVWSSDKVDSTKVDKENVLNTVEECSASTDLEDVAGASAVSALNSSIPTIVGDYLQSSALFYNSWGAVMANITFPFLPSLLNTKYSVTLTSVDLGYRDKANVALDLTKINPPNTRGEITLNTAMTAAGIADLLTFLKEYPHGCRINFTVSEITQ